MQFGGESNTIQGVYVRGLQLLPASLVSMAWQVFILITTPRLPAFLLHS